ncbi:MAG: metallophosphoesterase, partial [Firmicutes bacterium]|nr:metallophosphoesterase [Bacillota bacterium]
MKFLVISDTHGSYEKAVDLINKGNYDAVIHLGDLVRDAE